MASADGLFSLRHELRPGDLGMLVHKHGIIYARERGFDVTFEAYVAGPLAEFIRDGAPGRLWLAERQDELVGSIAVVGVTAALAQLRWFLVDPGVRHAGVGTRLLRTAIDFGRAAGYETLMLWTESALTAAARLYQAHGFRKSEEKPGRLWGVDVIEERYELTLR